MSCRNPVPLPDKFKNKLFLRQLNMPFPKNMGSKMERENKDPSGYNLSFSQSRSLGCMCRAGTSGCGNSEDPSASPHLLCFMDKEELEPVCTQGGTTHGASGIPAMIVPCSARGVTYLAKTQKNLRKQNSGITGRASGSPQGVPRGSTSCEGLPSSLHSS